MEKKKECLENTSFIRLTKNHLNAYRMAAELIRRGEDIANTDLFRLRWDLVRTMPDEAILALIKIQLGFVTPRPRGTAVAPRAAFRPPRLPRQPLPRSRSCRETAPAERRLERRRPQTAARPVGSARRGALAER